MCTYGFTVGSEFKSIKRSICIQTTLVRAVAKYNVAQMNFSIGSETFKKELQVNFSCSQFGDHCVIHD